MSTSKVLKLMKDKEIEYVDLRFTDIPGTIQHFTIPLKFLTEDIF